MANTTINGIATEATTTQYDDLYETEQKVSGTYTTKKIKRSNLVAAMAGQSTGILSCGVITGVGGTTISVTTSEVVVMDYTNSTTPVAKLKSFFVSGIEITGIASANSTYVAFDENGNVHQQSIPFTNAQRRDLAPFANIVHSNRTTINAINPMVHVVTSVASQLMDCMYAFGKQNLSGNVYSANGANLKLNRSEGLIFAIGSNYFNDVKDPHRIATASATAFNFRLRLADGNETVDTDTLDPTQYESAVGVATTMATENTWQAMRIYEFVSGLTRIQRGQATYSNLSNAISGYLSEAFVEEPNIRDNGLLRGWLLVKRSTTDLSDANQALFIEKRSTLSGSSGAELTSANIAAALGYTPEPAIPAGTTAEYLRGDKSLATFATDVLATVLSGLSLVTSTAITAADSVLSALGKLQAQITNNTTNISTNTSDIALKADKRLTTVEYTSSQTSLLTDASKEVLMNSASANSYTVAPSSSVTWTIGDQLTVFQKGAGLTTIIAGSGVTINNRHATLKLLGQFSTVYLRYHGSDVWAITGELSET